MSAALPLTHLQPRQDWLDRGREPALEPELPIVDPHHHLWDRDGWRYLLPELLDDLDCGHSIVATVFVQCRSMHRADGPVPLRPVGETEFVNGVAAMSASGGYGPAKICAGIVSQADLTLGDAVADVLQAHVHAGGGRFRGIRHTVAHDADAAVASPGNPAAPGLLEDPRFHEGFAQLAPHDMSFEAWLYHPQIDALTALARRFPDTRIVLNHFGGPLGRGAYTPDAVFPGWQASIRALGTCPNVFVKLGGLGMRINGFDLYERPAPPSSAELAAVMRPYVDVCLDAFGPARCMFESNFPVDKASYGYGTYWNACKLLSRGMSAAERTSLFSGTASGFYRL